MTLQAMKSAKSLKTANVLTTSGAYSSIAESTSLKPKDVKAVVEGLVAVAAEQLKKAGKFKLAGALNLRLKKKPATPARKGVNPFTREPCVFKAKPASKTVKRLAASKVQGLSQLKRALDDICEARVS